MFFLKITEFIVCNKIISIFVLFCFSYQFAFSAAMDNFSHIEILSGQVCERIVNSIKSENSKIYSIKISNHSSANYFEQILSNSISKNSLMTTDSSNSKIELNIIQNNVYYNTITNSSDSLSRNFRTEIKYSIISHDNKYKSDFCTLSYSDTIAIKDVEWLERGEMPFAKSPIPAGESSWLDNIIAPAIVFTSALVTVFLLFTVRSK